MRLLLTIIILFITISSFAQGQSEITSDPVFQDLNGDGKNERIEINILDNDGDYSSFILKIGNAIANGKHSYNVEGFKVVDIDKGDSQKEIAIYTPNVNGPDEYIIYRYDGNSIKQIGRTESTTTFNGDGTVDVESYMAFYDKKDSYKYDRDKDELVWVEKREYEVSVDSKITEDLVIPEGTFKRGQMVKITKAVVKDNCEKTGPYSWELCDEFYVVSDDGVEGWVTLEDMMGKIDLPLRP